VDSRRPVTNAICSFWDNPEWDGQWDPSAPAFALLDVGGYNYGKDHYESDHAKFPSRSWPARSRFQRRPTNTGRPWKSIPNVIGDFVWTGMDHLGESGIGQPPTLNDASAGPGAAAVGAHALADLDQLER